MITEDMSLNEIGDVIWLLNGEVYDQCGVTEAYFEVCSDGDVILVHFCGQKLWNSDDDGRLDAGDDVKEPLGIYLRREAQKMIDCFKKLNFNSGE